MRVVHQRLCRQLGEHAAELHVALVEHNERTIVVVFHEREDALANLQRLRTEYKLTSSPKGTISVT